MKSINTLLAGFVLSPDAFTFTGPPSSSQFSRPGRLTGTSFGLPGKNATFDYIVVGAGLSGSVVATRLAQAHSDQSVAVIEAGSFYEISNTNWSQIPYYSTEFVSADPDDWQPLIDWGLVSIPQKGAADRRIHYAQGKNIGGSSGRNQMIYHRPTIGSYDAWADHVGDDLYRWDNILPFFKKTFTFTPPSVVNRAANASANFSLSSYDFPGGEVQVSFPNYAQPISSYGPAAFSAAGFPPLVDFASGVLNGYGYTAYTIDPTTSTRSSAEVALLSPETANTALSIYQSCMARNIMFDDQKRATGVNVTVNGIKPFVLSARKEVIVSSGAWHSPQLLMVSGIGPQETLEQYNIPVISNLSGVGQNEWDTCNIGGPSFKINVDSTTRLENDQAYLAAATEAYLRNATGPLTNEGGDFIGWEKLPQYLRQNLSQATQDAFAKFPADWPEQEYVVSGSGRTLTESSADVDYGSIGILMTATTSRGNMTIQSASNDVPPVINPNWLTTPEDQEMAVAAYKRAREIWSHMTVKIGEEVAPGTNVTSDADILAFIQQKGLSAIHHASSTCAMGKVGDPDTVVDSKARVIGVTGLRVIDSSSFPFTPPGHTQGTTYAHAEKLVQDVINDNAD